MTVQDPADIISEYGADALRLYLINSPVVRAESLRFKREGVQGVVRDVFIPWYNAYRFLVQNVQRLEASKRLPDELSPFNPSQVPLCTSLITTHPSSRPFHVAPAL